MVTVITYGTYDLLHRGHVNLLRRAKALGDRLIVGVTSDDFDRRRGKLLVRQPLSERVAAVRATGLADDILVEEYEGQKIDDIRRYGVDIFAIGDDWAGHFDYLGEYCQVVYLPRTQGISSTELRSGGRDLRLGVVGGGLPLGRVAAACTQVGGMTLAGYLPERRPGDAADPDHATGHGEPTTAGEATASAMHTPEQDHGDAPLAATARPATSLDDLLESADALLISSSPRQRAHTARTALEAGKHVLLDTPMALDPATVGELTALAASRGLLLAEALKTAYSLAFQRMVLLIKGGAIGQVRSIEATCTSLSVRHPWAASRKEGGGAMTTWGTYALLPALEILGTHPRRTSFTTALEPGGEVDGFTRTHLLYDHAEATATVGTAVKSEGELVVAGTEGYVYVPSPWWKMDYFEVRKEDPRDNRRYFYAFDGEGIRDELADFLRRVRGQDGPAPQVRPELSACLAGIIADFRAGRDVTTI